MTWRPARALIALLGAEAMLLVVLGLWAAAEWHALGVWLEGDDRHLELRVIDAEGDRNVALTTCTAAPGGDDCRHGWRAAPSPGVLSERPGRHPRLHVDAGGRAWLEPPSISFFVLEGFARVAGLTAPGDGGTGDDDRG